MREKELSRSEKEVEEEKKKLQNENATPEAIESKNRVIILLEKDKEIVTLSEESLLNHWVL